MVRLSSLSWGKLSIMTGKRTLRRKHVTVSYDDSGFASVSSTGTEEATVSSKKTKLQNDIKMGPDWQPNNWRQVLGNIRTMRASGDAPVDTMGCDECAEKNCPPEVTRFQTLVSLMLSSMTKDQVTHAAMLKLREHGLTVSNINATDEGTIAELIRPVGFFKKKATYIKKTAAVLASDYGGDIPRTVSELCKLPGVGPKMAVLTANVAWGDTAGIGVDTHVHRISNRLGWTGPEATKTPEATREVLERWMPSSLWKEANHLLVGFGQQVCTPLRPRCGECLNSDLCPVGIEKFSQ